MIREEILKLRQDPKNYRYKGMIYYCPDDPYVVLPKRLAWMGWTFNFAHPKVWHMLFYVVFASTIPVIFFIYLTYQNDWPAAVLYVAIALHFILICLWAHKASTVSL